ncbi:hypothetical protein ACFLUG_00065 [Chloroflexota bacterium]
MNLAALLTQLSIGLLVTIAGVIDIWKNDTTSVVTIALFKVIIVLGITLVITSPVLGKITQRKKPEPTNHEITGLKSNEVTEIIGSIIASTFFLIIGFSLLSFGLLRIAAWANVLSVPWLDGWGAFYIFSIPWEAITIITGIILLLWILFQKNVKRSIFNL